MSAPLWVSVLLATLVALLVMSAVVLAVTDGLSGETAILRGAGRHRGPAPDDSVEGLLDVGARVRLLPYLRDIWSRREFAVAVPLADIQAQHRDTVLGNVWHVLNPLFLMGIYFLLFGVITKTRSTRIEHFLAFLACGVFIFVYTQRSVTAGASAIVSNEGLMRSIYFPRAILPISTVVGQTVTFLPSLAIMLVITVIAGVGMRPSWVLLVPILIVQALFNLGAAFVAARITDAFRDFKNVLPYFFRILIYMSGAMYSVEGRFIKSIKIQHLFEANPMYSFISLTRGAVMGLPITWGMVVSVLTWTVFLLFGGFVFFRSHEHLYGRA